MVDLYHKDQYINKFYEEATQMSQSEQFVSFLNMFFVFKKVRDVNLSNFTINVDDEDFQMPEEIIVKPKTSIKVEEAKPKSEKIKPVENKSGIIKKYEMKLVLEDVLKKTVKIRDTPISNKTKKVSPPKKEITKPKIAIPIQFEEGSSSEEEEIPSKKGPSKVTKSKVEEVPSKVTKSKAEEIVPSKVTKLKSKSKLTKLKTAIPIQFEEGSSSDVESK
jgi:hypothetical protein